MSTPATDLHRRRLRQIPTGGAAKRQIRSATWISLPIPRDPRRGDSQAGQQSKLCGSCSMPPGLASNTRRRGEATALRRVRTMPVQSPQENETRLTRVPAWFLVWACFSFWSGREDSNLRPQRPERCALTGLRHSPRPNGSIHRRPAFCNGRAVWGVAQVPAWSGTAELPKCGCCARQPLGNR